jgi:hypothetical protein
VARGRVTARNEQGATLILALVFLTAASLLVLGLLDWSGNGLNNVRTFVQNRTLNYAANSAMETAISNVRYSPTACPPTGLTITVPNPNSTYTMKMDIWCSPQPETEGPLANSRTITFTECPDTTYQAHTCSAGPSPPPFLTAVVVYDDYTNTIPGGQVDSYKTGQLCTTSCGSAMTIKSWAFLSS